MGLAAFNESVEFDSDVASGLVGDGAEDQQA